MTSTSPTKKRILILSANPKGTTQLRLAEEVREIKAGLRRAQQRDNFEIITAEAVRNRDIQRAILDNNPQIVHFSGHGTEAEFSRDLFSSTRSRLFLNPPSLILNKLDSMIRLNGRIKLGLKPLFDGAFRKAVTIQEPGEEGLAFEDETGQVKLVDGSALAGLFELFAQQVECVVLNACYSEVQARAIALYGDRAFVGWAK